MTPLPPAITPPAAASGEPPVRAGLLVMGRKRPGFDPEWGRQMEVAARSAMQAMPLAAVGTQERAVDDASLRRVIDELRRADCETLIVLQPTMGDGRLVPILAQLWGGPLVLWATPERPDSDRVSSCSLVGTHVFASLLRQLDHPFELAYGHPDEEETRRQLAVAVRLSAAARRLGRSKVGLVGHHAPGFINLHADPAALSRTLGVQLHHFGLHELYALIQGQDDPAVERDLAAVSELRLSREPGLGDADLPTNSRYYLAMRSLMEAEHLDALAVRCWPEMPNDFGHWPYLAMARLTDEGRIVALEGDVDGAVLCLMGKLLGLGAGYISDWLEHDERHITLWHPGHAPLHLCEPGSARLARHFNDDKPLVIDATLAADRPITLSRLWRCDGRYHMTACDARSAAPRRALRGAVGLAVVEDRDVPAWFDHLCHQGMPHHVTLFDGHQAAALKRLARLLRVDWVDGP